MTALVLTLIGVVIVNVAFVLFLVRKGRHEARQEQEEIAREASVRSMREGFVRVRGERWVRSHSPR